MRKSRQIFNKLNEYIVNCFNGNQNIYVMVCGTVSEFLNCMENFIFNTCYLNIQRSYVEKIIQNIPCAVFEIIMFLVKNM